MIRRACAICLLLPAVASAQPPAATAEPDWRGLEDDGPRKKAPPSPVTALVQNAPYRVDVATADGGKLLITNAFTLERRRVWEARAPIAAAAFSPDGTWLYAATATGEVVAVEPDTAKATPLGKVGLAAGEVVVDARGGGGPDALAVTLWIGKGPEALPLRCGPWTGQRRVTLKRAVAAKGSARQDESDGWPDDGSGWTGGSVSPNTKLKLELRAGQLIAIGRFGGGEARIDRSGVPAGSLGMQWLRDSKGVVVALPRKPLPGCRVGVGVRVFRVAAGKEPGWAEWTQPPDVEATRGGLGSTALEWSPDGMRWIGVTAQAVVLVEPTPRHRGHVAPIAPPSRIWPKVRPGVRPLVTGEAGALRHAELLIEQGDLAAAEVQVRAAGAGADVQALRARLAKLREIQGRRAQEWTAPGVEMPLPATPASLPASPSLVTP